MRGLVTSLAEAAGFGLVVLGVWRLYEPAGLIAAGFALLLIGARNA